MRRGNNRSKARRNKASPKTSRAFPISLKGELDTPAHHWIGQRLREKRGTREIADIAKSARRPAEELEGLESGIFSLNLGAIHQILDQGYGVSLQQLLEGYHDAHPEKFPNHESRPFRRDWYYRVRLKSNDIGRGPTPFFFGGSPKEFIWAVPFRRLNGQSMTMEFLELAPKRKRQPLMGKTAREHTSHSGIEIVHVINGEIEVEIDTGKPSLDTMKVSQHQSIHFHSRQKHIIMNDEKDNVAFLLIIRAPSVYDVVSEQKHEYKGNKAPLPNSVQVSNL